MSPTGLSLCCRVAADLPHRSCGILRAVRRKRWHGISQESALAFDTLSGEWSQPLVQRSDADMYMAFLSETSREWLGTASSGIGFQCSSMRSAWLHHYRVSHCLCGSVIVTMWYFIDPCEEKSFCLQHSTVALHRLVLHLDTPGFHCDSHEAVSTSSRTYSQCLPTLLFAFSLSGLPWLFSIHGNVQEIKIWCDFYTLSHNWTFIKNKQLKN